DRGRLQKVPSFVVFYVDENGEWKRPLGMKCCFSVEASIKQAPFGLWRVHVLVGFPVNFSRPTHFFDLEDMLAETSRLTPWTSVPKKRKQQSYASIIHTTTEATQLPRDLIGVILSYRLFWTVEPRVYALQTTLEHRWSVVEYGRTEWLM